MRIFSLFILMGLLSVGASAQTVVLDVKDEQQFSTPYTKKTIASKGVNLESGELIPYQDIIKISTDSFEAYERAVKRVSKKGNRHIDLAFTGDENIYAKRLEKLEKKRAGAQAARGAGGILMLIGVLAGDRSIAAAGAVTYGAGTIARDVNTSKTLETQTDAIVDLQKQQKAQQQAAEDEKLEQQLRVEWGDAAVDGVIALADKKYDRAMAFANLGATSDNSEHRIYAEWLKAIIYRDMGDEKAAQAQNQRLLEVDHEVSSLEEIEGYLIVADRELADLRSA